MMAQQPEYAQFADLNQFGYPGMNASEKEITPGQYTQVGSYPQVPDQKSSKRKGVSKRILTREQLEEKKKKMFFFPRKWMMCKNMSYSDERYNPRTVGYGGKKSFSPHNHWGRHKSSHTKKTHKKRYTRFKFQEEKVDQRKPDFDIDEYVDVQWGCLVLKDYERYPKVKIDFVPGEQQVRSPRERDSPREGSERKKTRFFRRKDKYKKRDREERDDAQKRRHEERH